MHIAGGRVMASKSNKEKAQELVDKAGELLKRIDAEPENKTQLAQQALELMKKAIALDEENDGAWNHKGEGHLYLNNHEEALNIAIQLNPKKIPHGIIEGRQDMLWVTTKAQGMIVM